MTDNSCKHIHAKSFLSIVLRLYMHVGPGVLVRFTITQPESFKTMCLEGQPGHSHGTLPHAAQL